LVAGWIDWGKGWAFQSIQNSIYPLSDEFRYDRKAFVMEVAYFLVDALALGLSNRRRLGGGGWVGAY